ncbi:MAG: hypothetical protein F4X59_18145 [Holophagales bacterium]|nr:hypothetical protein [Holophagales bacterium]MYC12028.1 hypothetical protein [Holophagales bacterium]
MKLDFDDFRRDFKDFRNDIEEFQEDTQGQFKLMNERLGKLEGLFHDLHSLVTGLVRAQDKTLSVLVDLRNGHSGTSDSLPS